MKKGNKQKIVDKRREQLKKAAYTVVSKKGYNNFTVRDIGREAGLSTGLVHYYFKNKEDLLLNLIKEMNTNLRETTQKELAQLHEPVEKMKLFLKLAFDQVENEKEYYYVIIDFWAQANRNKRMKSANIKLFESYRTMCSSILREGREQGSFPEIDVDYTATYILSLIQGIIIQYIIDNTAFDYRHYTQMVIADIMKFILKKQQL